MNEVLNNNDCCSRILSHIANKLAFMPQQSTYAIQQNKSNTKLKLIITDTTKIWEYGCRRKLKDYDVYYVTTVRGNRIVCLYIRTADNPQYTILYSHGNAEDIGQRTQFYVDLGVQMNCNILVYDYSGYGASSGSPSEKNIYSDIDAAFSSLKTRYRVCNQNIILFGVSIGSVPTIDLATRYHFRGVVLQSAFLSGLRICFPNLKKSLRFDRFTNIEKISKVQSPVLVIHGTDDDVVNISHGRELYRRCQRAYRPLWIEEAAHDDVETFPQFMKRLSRFIKVEL